MAFERKNNTKLTLLALVLCALLQFVSAYTEGHAASKSGDIAQILQKAEKGDSSAQYRVATMYQTGEGTAVDEEKASYWYLKAARQDITAAQTRIGAKLIRGLGIEKNERAGIQWLEKAASKNDGLAQVLLSSIYLDSSPQDFEKAFYWMLNAAKTGVVPAQYEVSRMYVKGIGTGVDYTQGVYWLEKAAEGGSPSAMKALGAAYYKGLFGLKHDPEKGKHWREKSHNVGNQGE